MVLKYLLAYFYGFTTESHEKTLINNINNNKLQTDKLDSECSGAFTIKLTLTSPTRPALNGTGTQMATNW